MEAKSGVVEESFKLKKEETVVVIAENIESKKEECEKEINGISNKNDNKKKNLKGQFTKKSKTETLLAWTQFAALDMVVHPTCIIVGVIKLPDLKNPDDFPYDPDTLKIRIKRGLPTSQPQNDDQFPELDNTEQDHLANLETGKGVEDSCVHGSSSSQPKDEEKDFDPNQQVSGASSSVAGTAVGMVRGIQPSSSSSNVEAISPRIEEVFRFIPPNYTSEPYAPNPSALTVKGNSESKEEEAENENNNSYMPNFLEWQRHLSLGHNGPAIDHLQPDPNSVCGPRYTPRNRQVEQQGHSEEAPADQDCPDAVM